MAYVDGVTLCYRCDGGCVGRCRSCDPRGPRRTEQPPEEMRRQGFLCVLHRALYGTRRACYLVGKLVAEVFTQAGFQALGIIPNAFYLPQRDIDLVVHGDDFSADAEEHQLDYVE